MKKVYLYNSIAVVIFLGILFTGCKDDAPAGECSTNPLVFHSLEAAQDTIETGESTTITATAEGYELSYVWTASNGFIIPGDAENVVTYTASPCSIGEITITCQVEDGCGNSETKNIIIIVQ